MAFGPSTNLLQQALSILLQGRQPSPLAPAPNLPTPAVRAGLPVPLAPTGDVGPLSLDTAAALAALQPQPVPPALPSPVDADAIRARFAQLAGPEPVAPVTQPDPLILKIARALQGFGAGVQGQGPQFLAGLREERERPQREFRAQKERFETRRQELGLLGEQAVLSAEDRRAARTLDLLDRQAERDYQQAAKESGFRNQAALERMKEAFNLERDARKAEAERLEQERKDAQARKVQIANLANTFTDDFKISRQQARRFAEHELNDTPLSAADAKQYARIEKYRRPVGGTGGSTGPVMAQLENGMVVPLGAVGRGDQAGRVVINGKPLRVVGYVGGRVPAPNPGLQPIAPPDVTGLGPQGFPLALGQPGAPQVTTQAEPALTKQQQARYDDIKRERPDLTDGQIRTYMRTKGWLQ